MSKKKSEEWYVKLLLIISMTYIGLHVLFYLLKSIT